MNIVNQLTKFESLYQENEWLVSNSLLKLQPQTKKQSSATVIFGKTTIDNMKWVVVQFGIVGFIVSCPVRMNKLVK